MESRTDKIRRLQGLIALEEAQKAILKKRNLYSDGRQVPLDNLKSQLDYEKEMELANIRRPPIVPPPKKSWQDNIVKLIWAVAAAVIAGLILYYLTHTPV